MTPAKKVLLSGLACAVLQVLACPFFTLSGHERRKANTLEFAYTYLAPKLRMPELCEKISPGAYLFAAFSPGDQVSYTRSNCYFNAAVEMRSREVCRKVRTVAPLSRQTAAKCREEVAKGRGLRASGGDWDWLIRFSGNTGGNVAEQGEDESMSQSDSWTRQRKQAALLPDFSRRGGRVIIGAPYESLGCDSPDSPDWGCFAYRCLQRPDEDVREACLEVASYVKLRQESVGRLRPEGPSGHVASLLKSYPEIQLPEIQ